MFTRYIKNKITNTQPQYAKPQPMKKPMLGLVSHHENQESSRDKPHNHTEGSHLLQDNQEQVVTHYALELMNLSAENFCVRRPITPGRKLPRA